MNNLDPEVAENPADLVVYGGTGRAARSWEAYDALVRTLATLGRDETMLVQSGKPVGVFRTHEWAPRVLIANSNLVGDWANWEEFRRLEELGLIMYGQMTAGSWIYIGTQGILQGTFETFAAVADKRFGGTARRHDHAHRRPRRDGWRPAARGDDERRRRDLRRGRPVAHPAAHRAPLPRRAGLVGRGRARARDRGARRAPARCPSVCSATPRRSCRSCWRWTRRSTSSPTRPRRTTRCPTCRSGSRSRTGTRRRPPTRTVSPSRPGIDGRARAGDGGVPGPRRRGLRLRQLDPRRGPQGRLRPGLRVPGLRAGVHPAAVLRGQGPVPLGRAVRRPGGHRRRRTRRSWSCSRTTSGCGVDHDGPGAGALPGPAGADLLARVRRAPPRRPEVQRDGRLRRALRPDRDRPGPPRLRVGRLAVPGDRGDARRLRRDRRLGRPERPGEHRLRRHLGLLPPRRRRRDGPLAARRPGLRRRRHRPGRRRSSSAS